MRKNIYIQEELNEQLREVSKRTGVAESKIYQITLERGLKEIQEKNYNFYDYIKEEKAKDD